MGNREALLDAAISCLYEKGYARTTARDIATAAGTSLAAIGYHYGTTRELLNQAVFAAMDRWGDEVQARMRSDVGPGRTYLDRFTEILAQAIRSIRDDRPVWEATLDMIAQIRHVPEIHELLRSGLRAARTGNVAMFEAVDEDTVDARQERTLGSFYYCLTAGLVIQWLLDPDNAPTAEDLAEALGAIATKISDERTP